MPDLRAALYVYKDADVRFEPSNPIDLYVMKDDYTAELVETIKEATDRTLAAGVWGFFYDDKPYVIPTGQVTLVEGVARKKPWPLPPPPPPPPFLARRDWSEHQLAFMVPLGSEIDEGGDGEPPPQAAG